MATKFHLSTTKNPKLATVETAFNGVVRRYTLRSADDKIDLLQGLSGQRDQKEDNVRKNCAARNPDIPTDRPGRVWINEKKLKN